MAKYTSLVEGVRVWVLPDENLKVMLARYLVGLDVGDFFTTILRGELPHITVGESYTTWLNTYQRSAEASYLMGVGLTSHGADTVGIFIFKEGHWLVKKGLYERELEDMKDLFEVLREAWFYKG